MKPDVLHPLSIFSLDILIQLLSFFFHDLSLTSSTFNPTHTNPQHPQLHRTCSKFHLGEKVTLNLCWT